jgi:hypothetical protein
MTTQSDAARPKLFRPVVQKHGATKTGYIAVMTDKPNPADDWKDESLRWVTAADYDNLLEKNERLRLRDVLLTTAVKMLTARAEAAEAKVAKMKEAIEACFEFPNTGPARDFLRAALKQGEG